MELVLCSFFWVAWKFCVIMAAAKLSVSDLIFSIKKKLEYVMLVDLT